MERKDIDRNLPLESYGNDNAKQLRLQVHSDPAASGEVNPTCASLSILPSSSSSSSSPPCFLKSVQAALKRHRPLGTMQTDALRARRVPIRQRRSSRFANGSVAVAVAGENAPCRDSALLVTNEDLGVACNQEKGSSEDFSPTLSSCSGTSPGKFPVREVDIVEKVSAQQQLVKATDAPNAAGSSDTARHQVTGPMIDCGSSNARFVEEKGPLEEISPTVSSNPDCITTWLEEGFGNNISFVSSKSVHTAHVPSRIISSDIHHNEMQPLPPEEIKSRFQGASKDSREEQAMSVINADGFPSQISPNASTESKMLSGLPPIKGQVPKQTISQQMTEISVKNLASQVEKIHGRVFDPRPVDPILPYSTMSSSCAITMSCHSGPPQSTGAASASKATIPTEVLAGSDGVQGAADNRLGPIGKESNRLLNPMEVPLFDGGTEGKGVRGDACILQPPSNSFSNANMDVSKFNKQGKASGKKKYDPDLFFKVNGKLYQKLGKIGSGGSSEVYKVIASDCNIYALKRIKLKGRDYPTAYGFCQEIEYLKKFKGRNNIIQLIDYEVTDKTFLKEVMNGCMTTNIGRIKADSYIYMVLEYGEIDLAHMLSQKLKDSESITWNSKENWIRFYWQQMLEAVNTIHEERIVHSDLKPANFLLVKGSLKLIDFGIAKAILSDTTNIQRDAQVGTLNYMSPEAFMWNEQDETGSTIKCGRPSDIWSLGCILYQMVYGKTPFADYKTFWVKFKVITDRNYDIVYEHLSNPWLIDLLKKCLAWNRDERWRIPQLLQHPFLNPPFVPLKE